jgi:LPS export ABC transporter permease LptG/LPS export ABC transporter permease LptF
VFRLLSRYVFREILTSALLGTVLATFVVFLHGIGALFQLLVGAGNPGLKTILMLFALAMPPVLPTTIPFGVLVGILIGLGRMASDGEITAMRAAGVSARRVIPPVLMFAVLGAGCAGYASLRLTPLSYRLSTDLINDLLKSQLSADIEEHVFDEDFPNKILYVGEVKPGTPTLWKSVFLADVTPADQRSTGMGSKGDGPLITVAREAVAVSDPKENRIQLSLTDFSTHEMGKDGKAQDVSSPHGEMALDASPPEERSQKASAMNTAELLRRYSGPDWMEVRIELHRRFALPLACIMLALVGIPLGIATRKGGKSAGYIIALFLGFFCYHLASVALVGVAKQRTLPIPVAIWLPDAAFFVAGVIFLARMERPGDRDLLSGFKSWFTGIFEALKSKTRPGQAEGLSHPGWRMPLLPQIVDTYLLSSFLFYTAVVLASFVSMSQVYFFFELVGDMIRNNISLVKMFTYLFFLTPQLIYTTLPVSILVAVLILFGVMSKQNEVTAFMACGVSVFRLCLPILIGATLFCGGLFAFDYYYVPGANRKQDALRAEIKGRRLQTYLRPDRTWFMGQGSRIYYYDYFDRAEETMAGVSIFELEPSKFRVVRQIKAERARWDPSLKTWVFTNGWFSDFKNENDRSYEVITARTFPELTEPPGYFSPAALQHTHMNVQELKQYIRDLQQRGFTTTKLQVQLYRKYSVPMFALIMAMIAAPFGFLVGNRGAMTGIGISMVIGIAYLAIDPFFQKLGEFSQLPPAMAAWSPDALFSLTGLYLLLRMRS